MEKPFKDWNEEEKRLASLDAKALNILFCAINQEQFNIFQIVAPHMTHGIILKLLMKELTK